MPKLPVIKPRIIDKFLKKQGFRQVRHEGSHARYHHPDDRKTTVPVHNKPLRKGTLKAILSQAKLSVDELVDFLH